VFVISPHARIENQRPLKQILTALSLPLLGLMLACGAHSSSPASTSIAPASASFAPAHMTYAIVGYSWNVVPQLVAQQKGFFTKRGLTVEYSVSGQSASSCQQVLAKAVEAAECSLNDMVQADEQGGAHLVEVMNQTTTALQYGVMAKTGINSWADLKGKNVMIGGPKDNTAYYFHVMARANGLKDSDYNLQFAGASGARFAALKSGAVDAAILSDPTFTQATLGGFKALDTLVPKYLNASNYAGGGPVVNPDWAKTHADIIERYIAGLLEANRWIYDPANKQALFDTVHEKLNLDQAAFDQTYKNTVVDSKQWSADGKVDDAAMTGVLKGLVDLGSLKEPLPAPTKYYDTTYLTAAQKLVGR
jgi:NitT/TauT family transport system substrate-binding protein